MKTIKLAIAALIFCFSIDAFAIEGLKVSVQSTNVVLSWPSATNETYIAQYRQALNGTNLWLTLTDNFPAAISATTTTFSNTPVSTNKTGFYRVVRDGVHIYGLTNGATLSGIANFPIEMAIGSTDQIVGVTFYADGNPLLGVLGQTNAGGAWSLNWDTTMMQNGDYDVVAEVDFATDDPVTNIPVTITVSNVISFPNYFSRVFGDQMWIFAQTIPDAAYQIDMYDENTNYLGTFSDYADDSGYISFLWDLTDGEGDTYDSTNFLGVFTVDTSSPSIVLNASAKNSTAAALNFENMSSPPKKMFGSKVKSNGVHPDAGGSSASAQQLWVKEGTWTPNNNWVVTYGLFSGQDGQPSQDDVYMIVGGAGSPTEYYGVLGTLDAYGLNGNLSPGNNAQNGNVFTVQDQASRSNLLTYLADPRYENFYFFGHGNSSVIGSYNGFNLTRDQIADALVNVPLSYHIQHAAEHPYRFVFIDACDAGKADFCEAFGIPAFPCSTNFLRHPA